MRCRQRISRLRYVLPGALFAIHLFYAFRFFLPTLPLSSQGYGSVTGYLRIQTTIASAMPGKMSNPWRLQRTRNQHQAPHLIHAGAGTDKTTTITAKSTHMVKCGNFDMSRVIESRYCVVVRGISSARISIYNKL